MGEQGKPAAALYSAFLSYSHQDAGMAAWLQRAIEAYRFPKHIVQTMGCERLKPVFRDRGDLVAAADLNEAVREALAASDWLIVVCSPASAGSEWVGREIAFFRARRGSGHVLTALVAGDERDAFHLELRGPDGAAEPLAADFRAGGDGRRYGVLKLVAAIAGLRLDELIRRDAQRRVNRIRGGAIAATLATAGVAGLSVAAINARSAAQAERARLASANQYQLSVVRKKVGTSGNLDFLDTVDGGVCQPLEGRNPASLIPDQRMQWAECLRGEGDTSVKRGNLKVARAKFARAYALTAALLHERPRNPKVIFAHAQSEYYLAVISWRLRDLAAAHASFERYAELANRLVAIDPNNLDWRLEVAYSNSNLGSLLFRETNAIDGARRYFILAQSEFEAVAKQKPADRDLSLEIADGYSWLSDVERLRGNFQAALAHRIHQRSIAEELVALEPRNANFRAGLLVARLGMARIAAAQGQLELAATELESAYALAEDLANAAPDNATVARQKRAIELFQAQTWLAMPIKDRPPIDLIRKRLAKCHMPSSISNDQELFAICSVEYARFLHETGNDKLAEQILHSASMKSASIGQTRTERWRINIKNEVSKIDRLILGEGGMM